MQHLCYCTVVLYGGFHFIPAGLYCTGMFTTSEASQLQFTTFEHLFFFSQREVSFSAIETTALECPLYRRMSSPLDSSHNLAVWSELAETRYCESAENAQSHTQRWWPARVLVRLRSAMLQSLMV